MPAAPGWRCGTSPRSCGAPVGALANSARQLCILLSWPLCQIAATWRSPERSGPPLPAKEFPSGSSAKNEAGPQPRPGVPSAATALGWGPTGAASRTWAAPPPPPLPHVVAVVPPKVVAHIFSLVTRSSSVANYCAAEAYRKFGAGILAPGRNTLPCAGPARR